jgi:hypothetical protein
MGEVFEHFHPPSPLSHDGLKHEHADGLTGHDHLEEIEVVIARLLHKQRYTGLTPRAQRIVAAGIAAMRVACADRYIDDERVPIPSSAELRAPLVNRERNATERPPRGSWARSSHARCDVCGGTTWQQISTKSGRRYGPAVLRHELIDGQECREKVRPR